MLQASKTAKENQVNNATSISKDHSNGFSLQPSNMAEALQMAEMLSSSDMVPKQYKSKPQDTLVAMMLGSELGLNPIQALQNIATINGRPSIYGDALVALVQAHPAYGGIEESFDANSMTATCTAWRKTGPRRTQTFSKQDAKTANLWGKQGPWTQYPRRMLALRARGFALRDVFADALAGLITREEAEDMPAEIDITPHQEEPKLISHYPAEDFEKNFSNWEARIKAGAQSADEIITFVQSKGILTEEQVAKLNDITPEAT